MATIDLLCLSVRFLSSTDITQFIKIFDLMHSINTQLFQSDTKLVQHYALVCDTFHFSVILL